MQINNLLLQMANPRGQQRDKPFRDALRMEALALANGELIEHPKGSLRWNAQRLLIAGETPSIREIADRFDGRVAQTIAGDSELDPIAHQFDNITDEQRAQAVAALLAKATNGHAATDTAIDD